MQSQVRWFVVVIFAVALWASFRASSQHVEGCQGYQDFYYLSCSGHYHLDAAVNSPAFPNVGMGCMWRDEDQMRRAYGYLGHR